MMLVMLYYQGGELVEQPEEFFLTMKPMAEQPLSPPVLRCQHLSSRELTSVISQMQGAQTVAARCRSNPKYDEYARCTTCRIQSGRRIAVCMVASTTIGPITPAYCHRHRQRN